jgi:hypothetical protein
LVSLGRLPKSQISMAIESLSPAHAARIVTTSIAFVSE